MSMYWLMSAEALQRRLLREIREARTPLTAVAARSAPPAPRDPTPPTDGVARIKVEGVLTPTPDMMAELYGEPNTTYPDLQAQLAAALASGATEIVWEINSPGGSVDGYHALIDDISDARASGANMRVVASEAQSAAYGIAAAVGQITATSRVASFGSVGVATSGFVQGGLCGKVVDITNSDSPDKRPNLETPEGRAVVVAYLDQLAAEFMGGIAAGRGVDAKDVAEKYGRGASMLASQAKALGLIDAIAPRASSVGANARTLTNAHTSGSVPDRMANIPDKIVPTPTVAVEAAAPAPSPDAFAAERAELAAFRAERDTRETAERRALVTELVSLGAERPATAWAGDAPVPRLASEPLASLRERVTALRVTAPPAVAAPLTPPAAAETSGLTEIQAHQAKQIKDAAHRERFIARCARLNAKDSAAARK